MSYMKRDQISGTDITINKAPSGASSFLSNLAGVLPEMQKQREASQKKEKEKVEYYITLREAGYSEEQATERVNSAFKGSWLNRVMKKDSSFQRPETDAFAQKQEKERADTDLTRAKADYYKAGGSRKTVIDKMTPNQLQSRLTYLTKLYSDDETVQEEIQYINQRLREISGFQGGENADPGSAGDGRQVIRRRTKDGRIAKFDANTKNFIGYE